MQATSLVIVLLFKRCVFHTPSEVSTRTGAWVRSCWRVKRLSLTPLHECFAISVCGMTTTITCMHLVLLL